eukprot:7436878-Karenia_brevis.AAC.1
MMKILLMVMVLQENQVGEHARHTSDRAKQWKGAEQDAATINGSADPSLGSDASTEGDFADKAQLWEQEQI